jgi:hypothetical protein
MTITIIYNEGDEVWTMVNNKPILTKIVKPNFYICNSFEDIGWELSIREKVSVYGFDLPVSRLESQLFKTKEELIASL